MIAVSICFFFFCVRIICSLKSFLQMWMSFIRWSVCILLKICSKRLYQNELFFIFAHHMSCLIFNTRPNYYVYNVESYKCIFVKHFCFTGVIVLFFFIINHTCFDTLFFLSNTMTFILNCANTVCGCCKFKWMQMYRLMNNFTAHVLLGTVYQ